MKIKLIKIVLTRKFVTNKVLILPSTRMVLADSISHQYRGLKIKTNDNGKMVIKYLNHILNGDDLN